MQEFFAALWLLKSPDHIKAVFQQCLTEEKKHMKHLIPFMCRLLSEKSPSLMKCLIPAEELRNTSDWFFREMIAKFSPRLCEYEETGADDSDCDIDILFLCQCLYESQCPEACACLLDNLDYSLDLSGVNLDPYPCSAVAYVITQSKERKIRLDLEDTSVSEQGMRQLLGCFKHVQWCDPLTRQISKNFLLSEGQIGFDGNELHLPAEGETQLFERAVEVLQNMTTEVNLCLHWDRGSHACHSLCEALLQALPFIRSLSFRKTQRDPGLQDLEQQHLTLDREKGLLLDLCLKAVHKGENCGNAVNKLFSLFHVAAELDDLLLVFYERLKTERCLNVLPSLRPLFQLTPSVWSIDLSERKASILLEVLKLQTEKKHVKLTGCSHGESEVKSLLQCLPYISQLSFCSRWSADYDGAKLLANLFCAAAEREQETGETTLELLSSVCTDTILPCNDIDDDDDDDDDNYKQHQFNFLLDLCSHVKDYETKTGLRVLPSLRPLFQSIPSVWFIYLSKRKASILLEVLKLQAEKKHVKLRGCSHGESEVKSFLQCLPYISQLSFYPLRLACRDGAKFLANLFYAAAEREQETGETTLELLSSVCTYETFPFEDIDDDDDDDYKEDQCDFLLDLYSNVKDYETKTGLRVLPSLRPLFQSIPSVWFIYLSKRKASILLEVLKLQAEKKHVKLRGCSHGESEVKSFLQCLPYISQLRMSEESFQQLLALLCEIQDKDLTQSFLSKVDLTSHCLNWELLHYLLQQSAQPITVGLRKNPFLQESITHLLPFLDRIVFKRFSPSFVLTAIRELHRAQASHIIPSLVKSFDHVISLTRRELDSDDCAALLFTLTHSDRVHLNLTWTSIPAGETESILFTLDKVSQLSIDRTLLLHFVHCCAASDAQQEAAPGLLRTLQHQLDLSSSASVELLEHGQTEPLSLTAGDCRAISTVLTHSSQDTELDLRDCEVQDGALDLLFPVLDRVHLRASKALVLQLVSLVPVNRERDTVRRTVSLCRALGGELDLSHTTLDQRSCGALVLMLDHCEGLTELDLSYCELTDQLLLTLATQLHKVQVLDLSHNEISDASAGTLLQLVSINPSIHTVRLFRNSIVDMSPFKKHQQFEIW
uniref:uncharacterized protein LOC109955619 isoform X2 n=1 Tax=Monopterus albus TaxID=43700 RepID=UPI0009B3315C|nr:uncharacterized protein LOC109955619 isoform X2 [Monopterus albus]